MTCERQDDCGHETANLNTFWHCNYLKILVQITHAWFENLFMSVRLDPYQSDTESRFILTHLVNQQDACLKAAVVKVKEAVPALGVALWTPRKIATFLLTVTIDPTR